MPVPFQKFDIECVALANGGKSYVQAPLTAPVRAALVDMFTNAGFALDDVAALTADNLVMVYSMARSTSNASRANALKVAQRLIEQAKDNPLGIGGVTGGASAAEVEAIKREYERELNDLREKFDSAQLALTMNVERIARVREERDDARANVETLREKLANVADTVLHRLEVERIQQGITVNIGTVHRSLPSVIQALDCGLNVYLYGPAGSGKTTAGKQAADALGLQFYFTGKLSDEYGLIGFKTATGETTRTPFREAYERGGLFMFDEYDGSDPNAVVAMNAALANGVCAFPDGVVKMHERFKCIAAGNTTMTGGDGVYTGRFAQDGAAVDRFVFIRFEYDEALERALCPDADWVAYVQACRAAVADRELQHLITPRASIAGAKLLAAGWDWADVARAVVWKGLDAATVDAIEAQMQAPRSAANAANAA